MRDGHELREDQVERRVDGGVHAMISSAGEYLLEGATKLPTEATVNQRVEHRVDVAEPSENGEDEILVGETVVARDDENVEDEKGRPAGDERPHNNPQRTSRPLFLDVFHEVARAFLHRLFPPSQAESSPGAAARRQRSLTSPFIVRLSRLHHRNLTAHPIRSRQKAGIQSYRRSRTNVR